LLPQVQMQYGRKLWKGHNNGDILRRHHWNFNKWLPCRRVETDSNNTNLWYSIIYQKNWSACSSTGIPAKRNEANGSCRRSDL
jgi:hypothetical protein